jgi:antirestriction protein ArdC
LLASGRQLGMPRYERQLQDSIRRVGDDAYAMEELVAELGALFLNGDLGVTAPPRPDHGANLSHWLRILKVNSWDIFTAASAASKAAGFVQEGSARQPVNA